MKFHSVFHFQPEAFAKLFLLAFLGGKKILLDKAATVEFTPWLVHLDAKDQKGHFTLEGDGISECYINVDTHTVDGQNPAPIEVG